MANVVFPFSGVGVAVSRSRFKPFEASKRIADISDKLNVWPVLKTNG